MKFLEMIMGMFGKKKSGMPGMDQVNDLKNQASDALEQHEDTINSITDKIPGELDDQLVDKAKDALK